VEGDDIVQLRYMLAGGSFKGKQVVLAVPSNQLLTGIMEFPPRSSGAPLEQLARNELSRMHCCEVGSFEMACWDLPAPARAGHATYVMAAGFSHEQAGELMDLVEGGGLDVYALDMHASAVLRACRRLLEGVTGIAAILHLGWEQTSLILVYQGVVVYERKLVKCGIDSIANSLGRELKLHHDKAEYLIRQVGLSTECPDVEPVSCRVVNLAVTAYCETLVEEMRIPLSYLANQYPDASPETLLLVGSGGRIPGFEQRLNSTLDFCARTVLPGDIVQCSPDTVEQFGTSLTVATGLAQFSERDQ
jgi:Tfp pilus assembly PilM family ATPase